MLRLTTVLITSLFYTVALGVPSNVNFSGTPSHNSVITVTGSGFGVKSPVAPRFWDPVDGNYTGITNGGVVPVGTGYPWTAWTQNYPVHFKTTNLRGKYTAKYTNTGTIGQGKAGLDYPHVVGTPGQNYLYVTWWNHFVGDSCETSNKWTRLQEDGSFDTDSNPVVWSPGYMTAKNYNLNQVKDIGYSVYYGGACSSNGGWMRMEQYVDNHAFPSAATIGIAENNVPKAGSPRTLPFIFSSPIDTVYMIGFDGSNIDTAYQPTVDWGEIYIDDTPARVEICNATPKSSATHCEIQIPQTTWIDNQLQVKLNQGSFLNGSSAYLYVIDASGNVNVTGKSITFDGVEPVVNGLCGDESATINIRPEATCVTGTPSAITENINTTTWTCVGSGGGTTDSCSAPFSTVVGDPAIFALGSSAYTVTEGQTFSVPVYRSVNTVGAGSVTYRTVGVTGDGTLDYYGTNGDTVYFADGETLALITVTTWKDFLIESTETFTLEITGTSGTTGSPSSATMSILDGNEPVMDPIGLIKPYGSGTVWKSNSTGTLVRVQP